MKGSGHMEKPSANWMITLFILIFILFAGILTAILCWQPWISASAESIAESAKLKNVSLELSYTSNGQKQKYGGIEPLNYLASFRKEYMYNDIHFLTSIEEWDDDKLEEAAIELFSNVHGDEINYVSAVIIEQGWGIYYGSYYSWYDYNYDIPLSVYNFFPADCVFPLTHEMGVLYVENVNSKTIIPDIAQALSTAYGYHYAHYYFGIKGRAEDEETEYYKLRSQSSTNLNLEYTSNSDYQENYNWELFVIAANDYMYLMGSEAAHRIEQFSSPYVRGSGDYFESGYDAIRSCYRNCRNATPHVNVAIELPHRVKGLKEYFYSFVDEEPPLNTIIKPFGDLNLTGKASISGESIDVSWDMPLVEKEILYTLVAYNSKGDIVAIVQTLDGLTPARAHYGAKTYFRMADGRYYYWQGVEKGEEIIFRLLITFPDGTVEVSDPLILYQEAETPHKITESIIKE